MIRWFLLTAVAFFAFTGCQERADHIAIEFTREVVIPVVKEGISEGVENMTIQGGAHAINPRIKGRFSGKWVVGVEGDFEYGLEGFAANVTGSTRGNLTEGRTVPPATQPTE